MDKQQEQLENLREIRSLMERSSRFISLSGMTGVVAGITAIVGIVAAYLFFGLSMFESGYYELAEGEDGRRYSTFYIFMITDILIVFLVAILSATVLTFKKAKQQGQPVWDATAKRLLVNIAIPLNVGAVYCLILLYHGQISFIAPATLIFYGLALLNASKYTLNDVRYLGMAQILIGLVAFVFIEYGLLFWAFGFGIMHIVYGITMYLKYEK